MTDGEIIKKMIAQKKRAIAWFGSAGKKERERQTIEAFLRSAGVTFDPFEVSSVTDDFPDVNFRDGCFEIKEMMDVDRRRHSELRQELEALQKARSLSELMDWYTPVDLTLADVVEKIRSILVRLSVKYPKALRNGTDLMIYCNLLDVSVVDPRQNTLPIPIDNEGWRSISVVGNSWGYILYASPSAPSFVKERVGQFTRSRECWG